MPFTGGEDANGLGRLIQRYFLEGRFRGREWQKSDMATTRQVELRDRLFVQPASWLLEHQSLPSPEWRVIQELKKAVSRSTFVASIAVGTGSDTIHLPALEFERFEAL